MRAFTDDLSLADLLEAASRVRRTLTLDLRTPEGTGRIYVSMGDVVHANHGELLGQDAIDSFLAAPELEYTALPDARVLFGLRAALEPDSPMPPPSSNGRRTMESFDSARSVAGRSTPPPLPGLPQLPHLPRIPPPPPPPSSRVTAIVRRRSSPWRRATAGRSRWLNVLAVLGFSAVVGIGTGLALDRLSGPPTHAAAATVLPPALPPRAPAAPVDARPEILRGVPPCAPPAASAESVQRLGSRAVQ